jgi:uncharacterized protein HemY
MSNNKQSSVEYLLENLHFKDSLKWAEVIEKANAMHKEEMEHFFKMGMSLVEGRLWKPIDKFDEAYNETYGGNK